MTNSIIHIFLALVMPPLLLGVIGKTKAAFAGRVGVGIHIGGAKSLQQPGDGQTVGR